METLRIVEYGICSEENYQALVTEVNKLLKDRWQPHGAPYFIQYENQHFFQQAMVKYKSLNTESITRAPFKINGIETSRKIKKAPVKKSVVKRKKILK